MSRNFTNAFFFFFFFLLTSLIISQEAQADHLYSPAPAPEAHEPGKAPAPQAPHQPINTLPLHGTTPGSLRPQECEGKCGGRCSATAYKKPCMFFCQKCCATCLCVPPGTYGNKQLCPCYNNWKTKRGGPKCP
ncbi:gibberellin-regulated protein 5-like [Phalaenopsis equestris]|uniref:gibberellin-regulated protein 5-like n=1 Tax=Phalaenopsis equestris TaxID=78828 RepID=UPI0009E542C3|nr:gibberellin-regulated protein 5-like [Phalaenopsis equestris]